MLRRGLYIPSAFQPPPSQHPALTGDGLAERSLQLEQLPHLPLLVWERVWPWRWHSGTWAGGELLPLLSFRLQRPRWLCHASSPQPRRSPLWATSRPCASSPGRPMGGISPPEETTASSWYGETMGWSGGAFPSQQPS